MKKRQHLCKVGRVHLACAKLAEKCGQQAHAGAELYGPAPDERMPRLAGEVCAENDGPVPETRAYTHFLVRKGAWGLHDLETDGVVETRRDVVCMKGDGQTRRAVHLPAVEAIDEGLHLPRSVGPRFKRELNMHQVLHLRPM